jgi:hypothetical protein
MVSAPASSKKLKGATEIEPVLAPDVVAPPLVPRLLVPVLLVPPVVPAPDPVPDELALVLDAPVLLAAALGDLPPVEPLVPGPAVPMPVMLLRQQPATATQATPTMTSRPRNLLPRLRLSIDRIDV